MIIETKLILKRQKNRERQKIKKKKMPSQMNSTKHTKRNLYPFSLKFFKMLKKKEHSQPRQEEWCSASPGWGGTRITATHHKVSCGAGQGSLELCGAAQGFSKWGWAWSMPHVLQSGTWLLLGQGKAHSSAKQCTAFCGAGKEAQSCVVQHSAFPWQGQGLECC